MREIEKQYSSDKIGQRVGWVRVSTQVIHNQDVIGVDLVTATVNGENGAQFSKEKFHPESEYFHPRQLGFTAVAAFSAMYGRETMKLGDESNLRYVTTESSPFYGHVEKYEDLLDRGTGDLRSFDTPSERQWVESGSELLDTLKELLNDADFAEIYPKLYYWMNGAITFSSAVSGRRMSHLDDIHLNDLLITDSSMHDQTLEQYNHAQAIADSLDKSLAIDKSMLENLTVFSSVPAADLPDAFIASRETAHQLDSTAREHAGKLAVRRLVYSPAGVKRSWPYMDASVEDVDKAYGHELEGLRRQSVVSAEYQLTREVDELTYRYNYAADAAHRFDYLAERESNAS